jgi:UDP-3-O-[3-hydroxymyristoyl] glucosamine N-acyltransferase
MKQVELIDILTKLKPLEYKGKEKVIINYLKQLEDGNFSDALYWCSDKNFEKLKSLSSGTVIISKNTFDKLLDEKLNFNCIIVENPRRYFMQVVKEFFAPKLIVGISKSSVIHESVKVNKNNVFIGENTVIENDSVIGDNVFIGHNTVILHGTVIGNNVRIGSNCTIGGIGFGYEKDENGNYEQIIHLGNVILDENVEIGNNVAIDRAVMGSTYLGKNVKVDNLVHIAHGVKVGENSLVIAHAMIAGSVNIGKNVWVAPSSSIMQKINVGDDSLIGMGSNVLKDVEKGTVVAGNPAKKIR